ncbi:ABC transporter [Bacillus sp. FJAT-18017]|uniref:ABC transporter ATP-binding protein n=1 Tax=Bacillus sp. FJAT-18017 TaxID=1705566 RepID=UPI0006BD8239|nr:ATP-binding cassette domain-containing protein [Bacillus sp. FJAT-18017]ALC89539.1 ABC transporter [Bacillus sp. FJAT-18017]
MAHIELNNVSFTYPEALVPALDSVNLSVQKGEFVVLFGPSGSGKSTLLRLLKEEIRPHGELRGSILLKGADSSSIGFVFQDPENQVVADDPLHEMVFGLENQGLPSNEMRNRVAEIVSFFGAEPILHKKMHELSGGKKQQMNLASVLLMQPDILVLDEPTSQLDPVSTRELLDMLKRLNEEFGMTIILAEHRLDDCIILADRMAMMDKGRIVYDSDPRSVMEQLWKEGERAFVPGIPSFFLEEQSLAGSEMPKRSGQTALPLSVKEGRALLHLIPGRKLDGKQESNIGTEQIIEKPVLKAKNLGFRYEKNNSPVLDELNFDLKIGEIYALLGGNGSGKSTLLKLLSNVIKPETGKLTLADVPFKKLKEIDLARRIGYLPQNPKLFFLHDTVGGEISAVCNQWGTPAQEADILIEQFSLSNLLQSHPYDLSGGELQKAAFVCLLLRKPEVLLLDEPTKGLDPVSKAALAQVLQKQKENGKAIVISTHDIEFAAKHATRCGMLFQGEITSEAAPEEFFSGNFFYSTMIQRLFRN